MRVYKQDIGDSDNRDRDRPIEHSIHLSLILLEINGRGSDGWEWKKRNMAGDALKNLNRDGLIMNTQRKTTCTLLHPFSRWWNSIARKMIVWMPILLLYWKTSSLRKDRMILVHNLQRISSQYVGVPYNEPEKKCNAPDVAYGRQMRKRIECRLQRIYCQRNESANVLLYYNPKKTPKIPTIFSFYSFPEDVEARPNIADEKPCRHGVTAVIDILFVVPLRKSWALIRSQPVAQGFPGIQLLQSQRNVAPSEFSLSFN